MKFDKVLFIHNADFDIIEANKVQVLNMCNAFCKIGIKTTLLSSGNCPKTIKGTFGVEPYFSIILVKPYNNSILRSLALFFRFIKLKNDFNFIITRYSLVAFLIKKFFGDKIVFYELHTYYGKGWRKFLLKLSFLYVDRIIVISNGLKEKLIENNFDKDKISVMPDGVLIEKFNIEISESEARKILNLPEDKIIISYIGSTEKDRDMGTFIEAAKKMPDVCFVIFGKTKEYLKKVKLKNFIIRDYTDKPELVYKASSILFAGYTNRISTINYMSPLKIFEYMAAKKPIIVADFPRIREIIYENEAYFYKSEDDQSLILKIKSILENKDAAERKATNAFEKVKKYTWLKRAGKIIDLTTIENNGNN